MCCEKQVKHAMNLSKARKQAHFGAGCCDNATTGLLRGVTAPAKPRLNVVAPNSCPVPAALPLLGQLTGTVSRIVSM